MANQHTDFPHQLDVIIEAYGTSLMSRLRALMFWFESKHDATNQLWIKAITAKLHRRVFKCFVFVFHHVFEARNRLILAAMPAQ
ncbi:TPA: hypothetical protein ACIUWU_001656 [Shigella sonnei]|nr:hypothetical protein [Shigella sonnei]